MPKRTHDRTSQQGFVMLQRGPDTLELLRNNPDAFLLLTLIAVRARYASSQHRTDGLGPRQALVGDYAACGLTPQRYRTAKKNLRKWEFSTFKATSKGTVATLIDSSVYDVQVTTSNEPSNKQPTSSQRAANEQPTTKEEGKKGIKKEENPQTPTPIVGGVEVGDSEQGADPPELDAREAEADSPERCDKCGGAGTIGAVVLAQVPGGPPHIIRDPEQVTKLCGEFKGKDGKQKMAVPRIRVADWPCSCKKGTDYNDTHEKLDQSTLQEGRAAVVEAGLVIFLDRCQKACRGARDAGK